MNQYTPVRCRPLSGFFLLAALALSLPACDGDDAGGEVSGLSEEEFIEVVVALREAERSVVEEDSARELFAARKAEILERHQTTEEEIRAFAVASSADLHEVAEIWEEISARLRRPMPQESAADPEQESAAESPAFPDTDSVVRPTAGRRPPLQ